MKAKIPCISSKPGVHKQCDKCESVHQRCTLVTNTKKTARPAREIVIDSEDVSDRKDTSSKSPRKASGVKKVFSSIRTALSGGEVAKSPEKTSECHASCLSYLFLSTSP